MVQERLIRSRVLKYAQVSFVARSCWQAESDTLSLTLLQDHTTSELKDLAKNAGAASGKPAMSYDGTADFWVRRYEDFENAFLDTEYLDKIKADEMNFIDVESAVVTVGVEYAVIDDGQIAETHLRSF